MASIPEEHHYPLLYKEQNNTGHQSYHSLMTHPQDKLVPIPWTEFSNIQMKLYQKNEITHELFLKSNFIMLQFCKIVT